MTRCPQIAFSIDHTVTSSCARDAGKLKAMPKVHITVMGFIKKTARWKRSFISILIKRKVAMSAHSLRQTIQQRNLNMTQTWDKPWLKLTTCLVTGSIIQGVPEKFQNILINLNLH